MSDILLSLKNIHKRFYEVYALKGVDFELRRGSVHALCGENGAGKSTLMKILMGEYKMDEGEMLLKGKKVKFDVPKHALDAGIAIIEQELTPVPDMTIAENIFLGREPVRGCFIDYRKMNEMAVAALEKISVTLDPSRKMKTLSVAEVQLVEIAKALSYDSEVLIMDEPTSALGDRETDVLFSIIYDLQKAGKGIVYISHRMREIYAIADTITVLRDGEYICTKPAKELPQDELVQQMISRKLEGQFVKENVPQDEVLLSVKNMTKKGVYNDIGFDLRKGEILGIFGLVGSGRSEFLSGLFGVDGRDSGEIFIEGREVANKTPIDSINNNFAFVTEDRKSTGLVLVSPVKENISITDIRKFSSDFFVNRKKEALNVNKMVDFFKIKASSTQQIVQNLSGGNQQKVVQGRWFLSKPQVLLLDEPTRGIDIGAKRELYKFMSDFVSEGNSIIMVSSELPEVLGMSDRIIVFKNGGISGELCRSEADEGKLMKMTS